MHVALRIRRGHETQAELIAEQLGRLTHVPPRVEDSLVVFDCPGRDVDGFRSNLVALARSLGASEAFEAPEKSNAGT